MDARPGDCQRLREGEGGCAARVGWQTAAADGPLPPREAETSFPDRPGRERRTAKGTISETASVAWPRSRGVPAGAAAPKRKRDGLCICCQGQRPTLFRRAARHDSQNLHSTGTGRTRERPGPHYELDGSRARGLEGAIGTAAHRTRLTWLSNDSLRRLLLDCASRWWCLRRVGAHGAQTICLAYRGRQRSEAGILEACSDGLFHKKGGEETGSPCLGV